MGEPAVERGLHCTTNRLFTFQTTWAFLSGLHLRSVSGPTNCMSFTFTIALHYDDPCDAAETAYVLFPQKPCTPVRICRDSAAIVNELCADMSYRCPRRPLHSLGCRRLDCKWTHPFLFTAPKFDRAWLHCVCGGRVRGTALLNGRLIRCLWLGTPWRLRMVFFGADTFAHVQNPIYCPSWRWKIFWHTRNLLAGWQLVFRTSGRAAEPH